MKGYPFFFLFALLSMYSYSQDTLSLLKGDLRGHDPVMIRQDDTYYIFQTGFGIGAKTSKDRVTWVRDSGVFTQKSMPVWFTKDIPEQKGFLWAPDIHFRDGKYHLYYSVSAWMNFNSSIGYASNTTLDRSSSAYQWEDHGQVISFINGGEGVNVIDPNVFVDKDGKVYLLYGSYKSGLRMVELDRKTGYLKDNPPKITTLTTSLGEGVYLIKAPNYYYIFASRGRCCAGNESTYEVVIGRSKTIKGPYLNKEGERWTDNKYSRFLQGNYAEPGRGHNGFFTERDTTFIVYHAYTRAVNGVSLLNIKPVYIDSSGWPTLEASGKLFTREQYDEK